MDSLKKIVCNGKKTSLWKDRWCSDSPLCLQHPVLYEICQNKDITIHRFLLNGGHLEFSRWLAPWLFEQWLEMVNSVYNFQFDNSDDKISWKWSSKGKYRTKSVYNHLSNDGQDRSFKHIWKAKIPYKSKFSCGWLKEMQF